MVYDPRQGSICDSGEASEPQGEIKNRLLPIYSMMVMMMVIDGLVDGDSDGDGSGPGGNDDYDGGGC